LDCYDNPGDGAVFVIKAWFDANSMPALFQYNPVWNSEENRTDYVYSWDYEGQTITTEFRGNDAKLGALV
jgi:hypothetical protein